MKTLWITIMTLVPVRLAVAQDVPPPPPLRGDAATLEDTMKFIRDKLPGKVNFVVYPHDNVSETDLPSVKRSVDLTNVSADSGRCTVAFHFRFDNGRNVVDKDSDMSLKQVREIATMQMDQSLQLADAKIGHPEINVKVDPPIFMVVVKSGLNRTNAFTFYEETLADRVSRALQHAVQLCGGGNQDPF